VSAGALFFGVTSDQPLQWVKISYDATSFWIDNFTYSHTQPPRTWINANPTGATPVARHGHEMVWDSFHSRVLMFGGRDSSGNVLNDIWEYDTAANTWTDVTPSTGSLPTARSHFGMAYDGYRNKVVIYGGQCIGCINVNIIGDTWEWDVPTRTWTQIPASTLEYDLVSNAGGATTYYWGSRWRQNNPMSFGAGSGTNSFKGFNNSVGIPICGGSWTSQPGNSSSPPATVPQYMVVIVSQSITESGPLISGDIKRIVVVKTESGYGSAPGHAGTGKIVAILCGAQ
jgi:hypothetical protein